mmetsp:Transcript_36987/g.92038  ORF Transcript_36987/g.92038 Transcript_36987/m.92038 type:complete len:222 (+) Transcript_36987:351-1016(+)
MSAALEHAVCLVGRELRAPRCPRLESAPEALSHRGVHLRGCEIMRRDGAVPPRVDLRDDGDHLSVLLQRLVRELNREFAARRLDAGERLEQVLPLILRHPVRHADVMGRQHAIATLDGAHDGHHLAVLLKRGVRLVQRDCALRRLAHGLEQVLPRIGGELEVAAGQVLAGEEQVRLAQPSVAVAVEREDETSNLAVLLQRLMRLVERQRRALRSALLLRLG